MQCGSNDPDGSDCKGNDGNIRKNFETNVWLKYAVQQIILLKIFFNEFLFFKLIYAVQNQHFFIKESTLKIIMIINHCCKVQNFCQMFEFSKFGNKGYYYKDLHLILSKVNRDRV